jgi:hypothetical protein
MISKVVLFIGGPKNYQTEEITHPQTYLQVPEKINSFVGLGSDHPFAAQEPNYKVVTYRLEKYRPGPTITIPLYVAQGYETEHASQLAGEYFYQLMLNQYTVNKVAEKQGKFGLSQILVSPTIPSFIQELYEEKLAPSLTEQEWYKNALGSNFKSLTTLKQEYLKALVHIKEQGITFGPSSTGKQVQVNGGSVLGQLTKLFPQLATVSSSCPSKDCGAMGRIAELIQHLNDIHHWKIETDIADWLESLDIKFEVKA